MGSLSVCRTLVKSPPELWARVSDEQELARHLAGLDEVRIVGVEPESTVRWEGDRARGTVEIEASGWGTKVTLTAEPVGAGDEGGDERGEQPRLEPLPPDTGNTRPPRIAETPAPEPDPEPPPAAETPDPEPPAPDPDPQPEPPAPEPEPPLPAAEAPLPPAAAIPPPAIPDPAYGRSSFFAQIGRAHV